MMLRMNQAQMQSYYAMMGGSTTGIWDQDAGDGTTYGQSTKNMILKICFCFIPIRKKCTSQ